MNDIADGLEEQVRKSWCHRWQCSDPRWRFRCMWQRNVLNHHVLLELISWILCLLWFLQSRPCSCINISVEPTTTFLTIWFLGIKKSKVTIVFSLFSLWLLWFSLCFPVSLWTLIWKGFPCCYYVHCSVSQASLFVVIVTLLCSHDNWPRP